MKYSNQKYKFCQEILDYSNTLQQKLCVTYTFSLQYTKIVQCSLTKSVFWVTKINFRLRIFIFMYEIPLWITKFFWQFGVTKYVFWVTKSGFRIPNLDFVRQKLRVYLHNYFDYHVSLSICPFIRQFVWCASQILFFA